MFSIFNLNGLDLVGQHLELFVFNLFFMFATFTDIKWMKIFDKFNILMLITRIVVFVIYGFSFEYLLGGLFMFMAVLFGAIITKAQIGGDIKFSGNIGLWIGFVPAAIVMFLAIIINFIFRKITKNTKAIALAPFLYVGFLIIFAVYYFLRLPV